MFQSGSKFKIVIMNTLNAYKHDKQGTTLLREMEGANPFQKQYSQPVSSMLQATSADNFIVVLQH